MRSPQVLFSLAFAVGLALSFPASAVDLVRNHDGATGDTGTTGAVGTSPASASNGANGDNGGTGGNGGTGVTGGTGTTTTDDVTAPQGGNVIVSSNGGTGGTGGQGGAGGDGANGGDILNQFGLSTNAGNGGNGGNSGQGGNGGAGGSAGTINLIIDAPVSGSITATARGGAPGIAGDGGKGGEGGNGGTASGTGAGVHGGNGGNGGAGYQGGGGGAGGNANCTINCIGGDAGNGGDASGVGTGQIHGPLVGHVRIIGTGTDTSGTKIFGAEGSEGNPLPAGTFRGTDGTASGADGTVNITVNAKVNGGISADAGTGTVNVTLDTSAEVGGQIKSISGTADSTLNFAMSVADNADYKQAKSVLAAANAAGGTLTVNGKTYAWSGFDHLVDMLKYLPPAAQVTINVNGTAGSGGTGLPTFLHCDNRAVKAFILGDGSISFNTTLPNEGKKRFAIGVLNGQVFVPAKGLGWTVTVENGKQRTVAKVYNRDPSLVATCVIEGAFALS